MPRQPAAAFGFRSVTGLPPRLSPPPDLGAEEREVFRDLVAASKPDAFRPSDLPLLSAYARAVVLERHSAVAGDDKAMARWERAVKAMVALSMRLRLSPQSRQANNPTRPGSKVERGLSVYERMRLEAEDGSA